MSSSPEENSTGPVIRDLRRIDPRTGQVRNPGTDAPGATARGPGKPPRPGKHSAAKPGGTPGSGAEAETQPAPAGPAPAGSGEGTAGGGAPGAGAPGPGGQEESGLAAQLALAGQLAERTADLQRVSAEYANYRKRVDRDRLVVREQALANVLVALLPVLDDIGRAREHGELVGGFEKVAQSLESIVTKLGLVAFGTEGEPFDPNVHEAVSLTQAAGVTEPTCVQILQPGYKVGERIVRPARVIVAEPGDDAATAGQPDDAGPDGAGSQESREDEH
jgi:molecular chaperone GrpE